MPSKAILQKWWTHKTFPTQIQAREFVTVRPELLAKLKFFKLKGKGTTKSMKKTKMQNKIKIVNSKPSTTASVMYR